MATDLKTNGGRFSSPALKVLAALAILATALAWPGPAWGQGAAARPWASSSSANFVMPQSRSAALAEAAVRVSGVEVGVVITEQVATTTMDISLANPRHERTEAELLVPVPDGAVVRSFPFQGAAAEPTAVLLPRAEAESTYKSIVAKVRDPALLEFAGYNLIRSSVFPVEAHGTQKLRLTYEQILTTDGNRVDYCLPRTESLDYAVPWTISVRIKATTPISTVYSPSHKIDLQRQGRHVVSARVANPAALEPGAFRLSYLLAADGLTASLLAYPDPAVGGGYFLLLAGLPANFTATDRQAIRREVTIVIDRSGSMSGEKLEQVRESALQILGGLENGESFNIIAYSDRVDLFSAQPVVKSAATAGTARDYLKSLQAIGGTNIHDALVEALRQPTTPGTLPIVLFLTDGLPTVGQTGEAAIRAVAQKANPHQRRIFAVGVGFDVNTPLLDRLATDTRAAATFVMPRENVEVKVGEVFGRLSGPVLADLKLEVLTAEGQPAAGRVRDLTPSPLPDLYEHDQLVLLGQYLGTEPLRFRITGNYLGKSRSFTFTAGLDKAATANAFVPRLWASRKIAALVDSIRDLGADPAAVGRMNAVHGSSSIASGARISADPRLKELTSEVVRLSTEFGILTEYTAFLAREGTDLTRRDQVMAEAVRNFQDRAVDTRSGAGSYNQSMNSIGQRSQSQLNMRNAFVDQNLNRVSVANIQQVNDRAFFRRGSQWVDSRLTAGGEGKPPRIIEYGSPEFTVLLQRLVREGRQGTMSLDGDVLLLIDGEAVLIHRPAGK